MESLAVVPDYSFMIMQTLEAAMIVQVVAFPLLMWEIEIECPALGFGPYRSHPLLAFWE